MLDGNVQDTVLNRSRRDGKVYLESGAVFDPSRTYRYRLWRIWDRDLPRLLFIMLNPSLGDAFKLTTTSYLCDDIAGWGVPVDGTLVRFGSLEVVNLFAYRTPKPKVLRKVIDVDELEAIGPDNDRYIADAVERADVVIAAWGAYRFLGGRDVDVARVVRMKKPLYRLMESGSGAPYHPYGIKANSRNLLKGGEELIDLIHRRFGEYEVK